MGRMRCGRTAAGVAILLGVASGAAEGLAAQSCAATGTNSCMSVSFTPQRLTPDGNDFANGVAVLGSMMITVIKCGRPPCEVTMAAANQPPSGLRVRVGGAAPMAINECPIDLTGINVPQAARAPVIGVTSGPVTYTVWVCQPLSWNPATTPLGVASPEFRFRIRQS